MKKIISLLLVFLVVGQLSEIKEQKLRYGDYIQQLAIVYIQNNSVDYFILCPDCTATLSVKKVTDNSPVLTRVNMTVLDTGLFGYLASQKDFLTDTQYRAYVNTTSPTYGSGIAPSIFEISEDRNITPVTSYVEGGGVFGGAIDGLNDILVSVYNNTVGKVINNIVEAFNNNFLGLKGIIVTFINFFEGILRFFKPALDVFTWILNGLFFLIDLFVNHPQDYIFFVILTNVMAILAIFIVPIFFIEAFIFLYVLLKHDDKELTFFNFIGGILTAHYKIGEVITIIIARVITLITRALDLIPTT